MIGSVPENYVWVANLLGLQRQRQNWGSRELQRAQQDSVFGLETRLIDLMVASLRTDVYRIRRANAGAVGQPTSRQPAALFFWGPTISQKTGNGERALAYLVDRPAGPVYLPLPVVDNILGDLYLQKSQYRLAEVHFQHFLTIYRGPGISAKIHIINSSSATGWPTKRRIWLCRFCKKCSPWAEPRSNRIRRHNRLRQRT